MAGVLQHLRSSALNKRPNPASMVDGQIAINYASGAPGMFFKDSSGSLVKVGPVHVGSSAPNAVPASGGTAGNSLGEQWLDTSGGTYVFKIWDGAAWRSEAGEFVNTTGDTMTGALGIITGSASTPGLFFSGDANSGLYSPGADQVAISTNGTGRLFVDASGNVGIGTTSPVSALNIRKDSLGSGGTAESAITLTYSATNYGQHFVDSNGFYIIHADNNGVAGGNLKLWADTNIIFNTAGTVSEERARIDSSGRLLVGTSSARLGVLFEIEGTSAGTSGAAITRNSNNSAGPAISFSKSRSTSNGTSSFGKVSTDDVLGAIDFYGADGSAFINAASISAQADGDFATAGDTTDGPGRLVFSTTADGASSPTERMRIDSTGLMTLAGPGIKFPATQVASADPNTLDDYEEGTFTPVFRDGAAGTAATQTDAQGRYTKIGNLVRYYFHFLNVTTTSLTAVNAAYVTGLPFAAVQLNDAEYDTLATTNSATPTSGCVSFNVQQNQAYGLLANQTTTGQVIFTVSQATSGSFDLFVQGMYHVA